MFNNSFPPDINKNKIYRFDIVTDPDDPLISDPFDELLSILNDNKDEILLSETNLDKGLVRYNVDVQSSEDETPDLIDRIDYLVGKVAYQPVTTSLDLSLFEPYEHIGPVVAGAQEVVKVLTGKILDTEILNVDFIGYDNNVIVFSPVTIYGTAVYQNPALMENYNKIVNLDRIGGYQVLSDDPLVGFVLEELYENNEYTPEDVDVRYVCDVALVPVGTNDNETDYYTEIKDYVDSMITARRGEGYFTYPIDIHNMEDGELVRELAMLWDTQIVSDKDLSNIVLKTGINFGTLPHLWFRRNVDLIKGGSFPEITLYGWWQFDLGGDFNQIFDKEWYQSSLQYGALLAYRKLGLEEKFIQPFTQTTTVNPDYSVTVMLPCYSLVTRFKDYFEEILKGYEGIEGEETWYAEPCSDLIEGVVKRYYVSSIDKKSMPMVLEQTNIDGKREQVLVFRSPILSIYSPDSPFDFSRVDWEEKRKNLIDELRNYYTKCHANFEPVVRDKIDTMGIEDLLNLVEIKERPNQPTYCYLKDTILNLNYPINPLTQRPFQEKVMIKAMSMEWGLRGLFDVGPIKGLYRDLPEKELVKPTVGTPVFEKLKTDALQERISGDIYSVEVKFEDGTMTELFDIATDERSKLEKIVRDLWSQGFFLDYWSSSVQRYIPDVKSYRVTVTYPLLLHGSRSKADGKRAMNYLEESLYQLNNQS